VYQQLRTTPDQPLNPDVVGAPGGRTSSSPAETLRQLSSTKSFEDLRHLGGESDVQALLRKLNVITEKIDDLADLMLRGASRRRAI
jgi:hypothetical protein